MTTLDTAPAVIQARHVQATTDDNGALVITGWRRSDGANFTYTFHLTPRDLTNLATDIARCANQNTR